MPQVSVILPTYNRAAYLKEAIKSVLNQTHQDFELIIIDDGSTDETPSVISEFQDRLLCCRQKNEGRVPARNKGLKLAQGEYIAWLDSDDLWKPDRLERGVRILDREKGIGLVHGEVDVIGPEGMVDEKETERMKKYYQKARSSKADFLNILEHYPVFSSSVLFRKECLASVGLFDSRCAIREDYDWYLRFSLKYPIHLLNESPIASYRIHKGNVSQQHDSREIAQDYIQTLQRQFTSIQQDRSGSVVRKIRSRILEKIAEFQYSKGETDQARNSLLKALRLNPSVLLHWRSVRRLIGLF